MGSATLFSTRTLGEVMATCALLWWRSYIGCSSRDLISPRGLFASFRYRSMFNRAAKTHLNRSQVARGYEKYLKPLLHQQKWPTLNSTAPRSKL